MSRSQEKVNRALNVAAIGSAILACLIAAAWLFARNVDPFAQFISLSRDFHVTLRPHGWNADLVFFSDAGFGPYFGSIVGFTGDPDLPESSGIYFPGVYCRLLQWQRRSSVWTVSISLAYPLVIALFLPALCFLRAGRNACARAERTITPRC